MENEREELHLENQKAHEPHRILDTISFTQQSELIRTFDPQSAVLEFITKLPERERQVLIGRYGLENGQSLTLEQIGKKFNLTRERIRQIEKDALKKLRQASMSQTLQKGVDLIFQIIEDKGSIVREDLLISSVLSASPSAVNRQYILFILQLVPQFNPLGENNKYHGSWYLAGFDQELLDKVIDATVNILRESGKPLAIGKLVVKIRKNISLPELESLSADAIENHISISRSVDKNPYGEIGLTNWPEINPKDVGDKAFLILSHLGKPQHYSKITELINKQEFDAKIAHKESVHNELIKDERFVLVGRGIYALAEWGYKKGVVADIIMSILTNAGRALARDEIIAEVLKQRVVKRNTVIVGLSNKNKFRKTAENKYLNV